MPGSDESQHDLLGSSSHDEHELQQEGGEVHHDNKTFNVW